MSIKMRKGPVNKEAKGTGWEDNNIKWKQEMRRKGWAERGEARSGSIYKMKYVWKPHESLLFVG